MELSALKEECNEVSSIANVYQSIHDVFTESTDFAAFKADTLKVENAHVNALQQLKSLCVLNV